MTRCLFIVASLFLGALPAHAQVFKCKGPKGVVYQDGPCEGGTSVDTRSSRGMTAPKSSGASSGGGSSAPTKPSHPVLPEKMRR